MFGTFNALSFVLLDAARISLVIFDNPIISGFIGISIN
jgi:hypothetical protein